MTAIDYTELYSEAKALIQEAGVAAVLRKVTGEVFDAPSGKVTAPGAEVDTNVMVVLIERRNMVRPDGTGQAIGGTRMLMAGDVNPAMKDRILVGGKTYTIEEIVKVSPANQPLLYKVYVKGDQ